MIKFVFIDTHSILCGVIYINYTVSAKNGSYIILFVALPLCIGITVFPEYTGQSVANACMLCLNAVLPSLFPFMIATNLLLTSGIENILAKYVKRPFEALFHLNASLFTPFIIGLITGYPQGAMAICAVYDKGSCTKKEAEHALALCNNTSLGFLCGTVGSLCRNSAFGIKLYLIQITTSIIYAVITRPKDKPTTDTFTPNNNVPTFDKAFSLAVKNSIYPCALICSYIMTFAFILRLISACLEAVCAPYIVSAVAFSFLELTNACVFLSGSGSELTYAFIGLAVTFAGASIHMQIYSCINGRFCIKKFFFAKLITATVVFWTVYFLKIS